SAYQAVNLKSEGLLVYLNSLSDLDLIMAFSAMNFPLSTAFIVSHKFGLKSILFDIRIATPVCFLSSFDWKAFSQPFTLSGLIIMWLGDFFLDRDYLVFWPLSPCKVIFSDEFCFFCIGVRYVSVHGPGAAWGCVDVQGGLWPKLPEAILMSMTCDADGEGVDMTPVKESFEGIATHKLRTIDLTGQKIHPNCELHRPSVQLAEHPGCLLPE
ncbi:hypothetical protein STEG23_028275, partial [Scotinomys teguina]